MLMYLREQGCEVGAAGISNIAFRGHLPALQYLHEVGCDWRAPCILDDAAEGGNLDMVKWLLQQEGVEMSSEAMANAAAEGHTAVCAYLLSQQCPWDSTAWNEAARCKQHDILHWLQSSGCPCNIISACEKAVLRGHISTVELILQLQGAALSVPQLTRLLNVAGAFNQLAAAQWLRQQGAEWPDLLQYRYEALHAPGFVSSAATSWRNETLAWARAEGCTSPTA
jgi:hypothetical protein